jgi:hypothetical protein
VSVRMVIQTALRRNRFAGAGAAAKALTACRPRPLTSRQLPPVGGR